MKKLNDELAKLLGIEPKEQTNCGLCPYDEDLDESDICPHYMADECDEIELIYPDFTSPYNFVLLYELKVFNYVTLGQIINNIYHTGSRKEFINILIKKLKTDNYDNEHIKQQAQQTDWSH